MIVDRDYLLEAGDESTNVSPIPCRGGKSRWSFERGRAAHAAEAMVAMLRWVRVRGYIDIISVSRLGT